MMPLSVNWIIRGALAHESQVLTSSYVSLVGGRLNVLIKDWSFQVDMVMVLSCHTLGVILREPCWVWD